MKSHPPLTIALIAICAVLALQSGFGKSTDVLETWLFASPGSVGLADILSGQVWRLLTPAFIHFGPMHLLFNMMWLWDLGNLIERRKGPLFLAGFVLAVGIASNFAQYLLGDSPWFGGMSGVVYGLLGYVWMQGRHNPRFGYTLHQSTVVMMLVWFVLCWTGLLGPIANWAHSAGLGIGVVWGFLDRAGGSHAGSAKTE
jgi:membrane associated rhomboid family serine protease